ncbi:MAG: DUF2380 domain-containing protein [Deltaproteobacteria bacterium]|nr:DUF2380 domain-containing protein [Deltaproteobacteria bacterium]
MNRPARLAITLLLLLSGPWAALASSAEPLMAVLDFKNKIKGKDAEEVDRLYFTSLTRSSVLAVLPHLRIMTRENMEVLVAATGRKLADCEGECEVDTGRKLGADLVVSGDLFKVGKLFKLDLRLRDTREGRLLAGGQASGASVEELDAAVAPAVAKLVASRVAQEPVESARAKPVDGAQAPQGQPKAEGRPAAKTLTLPIGTFAQQSGNAELKDGALWCDGCSLIGQESLGDFVLEGDVEFLGGTHNLGIVWRLTQLPDNPAQFEGYTVGLLNNGAYNVYRGWRDAGWFLMTSNWTKANDYKPGVPMADKNHVRLEAMGPEWVISVNGKELDRGTNAWFRAGALAFSAGADTLVRWSNLKLERKDGRREVRPLPPAVAARSMKGTFTPVPGGYECFGCQTFLEGDFTDSTIEVEVDHLGGPTDRAVAVCGRSRELTSTPGKIGGICLNWVFDGKYNLFSGSGDAWTRLTHNWNSSPDYKPTPLLVGGPHRLRLDLKGKSFTVSVDGQVLDEVESGDFRFGQVYLGVETPEQRALFRNIQVTKAP